MPPVPDLLSAFRSHLVTAGVVRLPSTAGSALPPLWLARREGCPAPGEGQGAEVGATLVMHAFVSGGFPAGRWEGWMRRPVIDLVFRGLHAREITDTENKATVALTDRVDFMLSGLHVIECEQWRALQLLRSDAQSFDYSTAYRFELFRP